METNSMTRTRMFIGLETSTHKTHIHPQEVIDVVRDHVDAGTFYEGKGLWMGELENSIVFESMNIEDHFRSDSGIDSVKELKALLEDTFDQDSVMVERAEVEVGF